MYHSDVSSADSGVPHVANQFFKKYLVVTRKYLPCGYILGVLTHTTAWENNETLK